jgi:hypothetical protein
MINGIKVPTINWNPETRPSTNGACGKLTTNTSVPGIKIGNALVWTPTFLKQRLYACVPGHVGRSLKRNAGLFIMLDQGREWF